MKNTIKNANTDYQLGKFDTFREALYYHKKNAGMEKLSRDEMKNCTADLEQGRSLAKKNLELEYPFLLIKRGFIWMESNFHWVILGGCVALALIAWWGISTGRLV
jgi:hypothetical protein